MAEQSCLFRPATEKRQQEPKIKVSSVPRRGHSSIFCWRLLSTEAVIHAQNRGSSLFDDRSSVHTSHLTKKLR